MCVCVCVCVCEGGGGVDGVRKPSGKLFAKTVLRLLYSISCDRYTNCHNLKTHYEKFLQSESADSC